MLNPDPLKEVASCINRMGPDKGRWVKVLLHNGHSFDVASVTVAGSLLMGVTNPNRPREDYLLINPAAVAAYSPGGPLEIASAA